MIVVAPLIISMSLGGGENSSFSTNSISIACISINLCTFRIGSKPSWLGDCSTYANFHLYASKFSHASVLDSSGTHPMQLRVPLLNVALRQYRYLFIKQSMLIHVSYYTKAGFRVCMNLLRESLGSPFIRIISPNRWEPSHVVINHCSCVGK